MSTIQNINPYKGVGFFLGTSFHSYFKEKLPPPLSKVFNEVINHHKEHKFPIIDLYKSFNALEALNLNADDYEILECVISSLTELNSDIGDFLNDFIKFKSLNISDLETKMVYASLRKTTIVDVFQRIDVLKNVLKKEIDPLKKALFENISSQVCVFESYINPAFQKKAIPVAEPEPDDDDNFDLLIDEYIIGDLPSAALFGSEEIASILAEFVETAVETAIDFNDLNEEAKKDEESSKIPEIPEKEFYALKRESCSIEDLSNLISSLEAVDPSWIEMLNNAINKNSANEHNIIPLCLKFTQFASKNSSPDLKELLTDCMDFYNEKKWDLTSLMEALANTHTTDDDGESIKAFCRFLKILRRGEVKESILFPNKPNKGIISHEDFEECFSLLSDMKNIFKEGSIDYEKLVELKMIFSQIDTGLQYLNTDGMHRYILNSRLVKSNTIDNGSLRRYFLEHKENLSFIEVVGRVYRKPKKSHPFQSHFNSYALSFLAHELKKGTFSIQPYRALNHALEKNEFSDLEDIQALFTKIVIHSLLSVVVRSPDSSTREEASTLISSLAIADDTPFKFVDGARSRRAINDTLGETALEVNQQTLKIYERAFNMHHGSFTALTYECKRTPDGEFPLLVRFAAEVGKKEKDGPIKSIEFIDNKKVDNFPGRGFIISNLDLHKIFIADKNTPTNPFKAYKEAWTDRARGITFGDEIDDFEKTRFVFTRGLIAITGPRLPKYLIKDRNNTYTHYSLVVFNDHFENKSCNVAYLIPTKILDEKLKDTTIKYNDFKGFGYAKKDSSKAELDLESIIKACNDSESNVLDLAWGSNFSGTLSNAFPPKELPYHEWERSRRGTKDFNDHTHKVYSGVDLSTFREAHYKVYLTSRAYFNLFDIFNLSLENYHKGETSGDIVQIGDIDEFELAGLDNEQLDPEEGSGINPNAILMLKEAYRWNQSNEKPILVPVNALDSWGVITNPPFILDTKEMTLKLSNGFVYRFPETEYGIGPEERMVWNSALKHVVGPDKFHLGLRFINRELVPENILEKVQ